MEIITAGMASEIINVNFGGQTWTQTRFAAEVKGTANGCGNYWTVDLPDLESVQNFYVVGCVAVLTNAPHRTVDNIRLYDRVNRKFIMDWAE